MTARILTCVYCGHEYPQDTPAQGDQVLTDHIKVCAKHPLRKAENDIATLRSALVGLVGASTEVELRQIEIGLAWLPAEAESTVAAARAAVHALRATLPAVPSAPQS